MTDRPTPEKRNDIAHKAYLYCVHDPRPCANCIDYIANGEIRAAERAAAEAAVEQNDAEWETKWDKHCARHERKTQEAVKAAAEAERLKHYSGERRTEANANVWQNAEHHTLTALADEFGLGERKCCECLGTGTYASLTCEGCHGTGTLPWDVRSLAEAIVERVCEKILLADEISEERVREDVRALLREREETQAVCNKCGWAGPSAGRAGTKHAGCDYLAAEVRERKETT